MINIISFKFQGMVWINAFEDKLKISNILNLILFFQGILPFEFINGESANSLGLTGKETFTINLPENFKPQAIVSVETSSGIKFNVKARLDTEVEITYYSNGGILNYMIRKMIS